MQWKVAVAVVVVLAAATAGCGSSSTRVSSPVGFAQQADAICKRVETRVYALLAQGTKQQAAHQTQAARETGALVLAEYRKGDSELNALSPPAARAATYDQYKATLSSRRVLLAMRVENPAKYSGTENHTHGTPLYEIARKEGALLNKGQALARVLRLKVCH